MDKKEAVAKLEAGLQSLLNSSNWRSYLSAMNLFHDYSWNNTLLIWAQMPTSTRVAGFNTWKKLGRFVKKGEKGIAILAPLVVKKKDEETILLDESDNEKVLVGFKVVHVFDVSQTEGAPLPEVKINQLEGDGDLYQQMLSICPFPIVESDDLGGANGKIERANQTISILSSLSNAHKAKTLAHEWAHGLLHVTDPTGMKLTREIRELEAESTAFIVCDALGLDTSEYTFGYLADWNGDDAIANLRKSAGRIQQAADQILAMVTPVTEVRTAEVIAS